MVLGVWGASEKFAASMCFEFFIFRQEKRQKITKIIFRLLKSCNLSPIRLFCPRNPKSHFSWKIQKDARRKMIEIRQIKSKKQFHENYDENNPVHVQKLLKEAKDRKF